MRHEETIKQIIQILTAANIYKATTVCQPLFSALDSY